MRTHMHECFLFICTIYTYRHVCARERVCRNVGSSARKPGRLCVTTRVSVVLAHFGGALLPLLMHSHRVHSLINSLSNDFIPLSFALLTDGGTFAELGKNSIWSSARCSAAQQHVHQPTAPLHVYYAAVAVDDGCRNCPGWNDDPWWFNNQVLQLTARVEAGVVSSLPFERFAFEKHAVHKALRLLQRGA